MKILINPNENFEIKIPNEINANDFLKLMNSFDNVVRLIRFNLIKQGIKEDENFRIDENGNKVPRVHKNLSQKKLEQSLNKDGTTRKSYTRKIIRNNTRLWCDTREKVLDLMQYAYHGTRQDKERIVMITKIKWNDITKSFYGLKKRYNIQPQEVGLIDWGNETMKGFNFRIPNWIIKSYTGYFDENGNTGN